MPAVLCGEAGASELAAGRVLPAAADRAFRRDRFGAWDRLAGAGLAGAAALSPGRTGGVAAGSFHDLAHAAVGGCGDAQGSVTLSLEQHDSDNQFLMEKGEVRLQFGEEHGARNDAPITKSREEEPPLAPREALNQTPFCPGAPSSGELSGSASLLQKVQQRTVDFVRMCPGYRVRPILHHY